VRDHTAGDAGICAIDGKCLVTCWGLTGLPGEGAGMEGNRRTER
jgi:hypothetical protein